MFFERFQARLTDEVRRHVLSRLPSLINPVHVEVRVCEQNAIAEPLANQLANMSSRNTTEQALGHT